MKITRRWLKGKIKEYPLTLAFLAVVIPLSIFGVKTQWMYLFYFVFIVTSPLTVKWLMKNDWRWKMQDKHCAICGRSWWRHHRNVNIVTCPGKKS